MPIPRRYHPHLYADAVPEIEPWVDIIGMLHVEADDDLLVLDQGRIVARGEAKAVVAETGEEDLGAAFRQLIRGDADEDIAV